MPRVCLISSRHLSYNPRLYKEARALGAAGISVRAVTPNLDPKKSALDDNLMETESWRLDRVSAQRRGKGRSRWLVDALRQRLLRAVPLLRRLPHGTERAYSRHVDALYRTAADQPADLYVAHNLQALPAAAWAAEQHGARLGFDAEDFHRGEFHYDHGDSLARRLTVAVEDAYLPRCDHLTAASLGIADAYADAIDIERPTVILNVFPRSERSGSTPEEALAQEAPDNAYSLYWYSQTIGPNRGLEHVVRAIGRLSDGDGRPVVLSLRGSWADGFEDRLRTLAAEVGAVDCIRHLPPAPPDELVERATRHDVGLALEQPVSLNREICVTNKFFAYLLAGLPVVATRTPGQETVCRRLPEEATRLCAPADPRSIAEAIRSLLHDPGTAQQARDAAWKAGEERYNWDVEQERLIEYFQNSLSPLLPRENNNVVTTD
jgi:glycosyltransferase involved in cell wall biosynthesis